MAFEKIGLGGILSFDHQNAIRGMQKASKASQLFSKTFSGITSVARSVGQGMNQLSRSARSLGVAALPMTAAIGFGTKQSIDFEKQMSAIRAITGATAEEMAQLTQEAKRQGATTAFSATQAGQGMEFLSRAGFSVREQISAIGPLLNAAAADGMELGETANIVANALRSMNMPASDAARVADVLALTSAKSNTNITQLGEALRYAAPQAKSMNIEFEQLAAVLGAAGDAGLQGSIGGTSFTQAMIKLLKPTGEGEKLLNKYNITIRKTEKGTTDIIDTFKQLSQGIKEIEDPLDQATAISELFGVRGQKAVNAVMTAIDAGRLEKLTDELYNAEGSAKRMSEIRLDNLAGSFTLLKSAAEGFVLETAGMFLGPMRQGVKNFTDNLSNTVLVLQELNTETGLTEETSKKAGATNVAVAKGIRAGIDTVIDAWEKLRDTITDSISSFTGNQSPEMIQQISKIATMIFIVVGAIAPVLIALSGIGFIISSVIIPAFGAIGTIVSAVFGSVLLPVIAAAGAAFLLFRQDGESVGDTFSRMFDMIKSGFDWIMETAVNPFLDAFKFAPNLFGEMGDKIIEIFGWIKEDIGTYVSGMIRTIGALKPLFIGIFTVIGTAASFLVQGIGMLFTGLLAVIGGTIRVVTNIIMAVVESVVNAIKWVSGIIGSIAEFAGLEDISKPFKEFGAGKFDIRAGFEKPPKIEEESTALMSTELENMSMDQEEKLMSIDPKSADSMAEKVGNAVGANMPKDINVESKMCVDGKTVAKATQRHRQEVSERSGFKATPWQRRISAEHGAVPVGGV